MLGARGLTVIKVDAIASGIHDNDATSSENR